MRFSHFLFFLCTLPICTCLGQSDNVNYIFIREPQIATSDESGVDNLNTDQCRQTIQYFDQLGRIVQTNQKQLSPSYQDIISPVEFDQFGRNSIQYLPYQSDGNTGGYDNNYNSNLINFYSKPPNGVVTTLNPFFNVIFDNSPLNEIVEKGAPGESWQIGTDHTLKFDYTTNTTDDKVMLWDSDPGGTDIYWYTAFYQPNQLFKQYSIDENGDSTATFTDKEGKLILKESYNNGQKLRTYYLYNDFNKLIYVITPKGEKALPKTGGMQVENVVKDNSYFYIYDKRQRMREKQLPGLWDPDEILMTYDTSDNMTTCQDGNMRTQFSGKYIKYDDLNRPIEEGIYTYDPDGPDEAVPLNQFPYSRFFYDNYDFNKDGHPDYSYQTDNDFYANVPATLNNERMTGRKDLDLTSLLDTFWITTAYFYDKYNRMIQVQKNNYEQGKDIVTNAFDFVGKLVKSKHTQTIQFRGGSPQTHTLFKYYEYEQNSGRLIQTHENVDETGLVIVSTMSYNAIGQLIEKKLGPSPNQPLQSIDYAYNPRGWLKSINQLDLPGNDKDIFGMEINYDQPSQGGGINGPGSENAEPLNDGLNIIPQYNGNISAIKWQGTESSGKKAWTYEYDKVNRLKSGVYYENPSNNYEPKDDYREDGISYDEDGNILTVARRGQKLDQSYDTIDNLNYGYKGDRLVGVDDDVNEGSGYDFCDNGNKFDVHNPDTWEYTYDDNGNMTSDANKGIVSITYNFLNLPKWITLTNNQQINYVYLSTGEKVMKNVYDNGKIVTATNYIDGFVYVNGALSYIIGDEGRILYDGNKYTYEYEIKDHLGDTRVCFADPDHSGNIQITQERSYYSFGLEMKGLDYDHPLSSNTNNYLYNGKEFQTEDGLQWYDYGARFYDPQLGRWHSVDPKSEKYYYLSPFSYVANNPLKQIDYEGKEIVNTNKMVLSNKTLISKLKEFDLAVARISKQNVGSYTFTITGGDRYEKDGKIFSATNDNEIPASATHSRHLRSEGAVAVDLTEASIDPKILKEAAKETGFRYNPDGDYDDGHFHIDLKNKKLKDAYLNDKDVNTNNVPSNEDFKHNEKSRNLLLAPERTSAADKTRSNTLEIMHSITDNYKVVK